MVKIVTDKQLQFINFVFEIDRMGFIKLGSYGYGVLTELCNIKEYNESDVIMLDSLTKQIFEQPNVRDMWRVWSNK
jgi:archaellum biogenesis ATPase FlaH